MERTITIDIGGKKVKLNPFVKEVSLNVILGLLKPLRDVATEEDIVISISRS